ncbi:hypothetical protein Tco_0003196 [Tanacetum coccineum]
MISRPSSSNEKNKVEEHPRTVKSSLNKINSISKPISNAIVKHSVRNAKFETLYVTCNKCLFDATHDMCLINFMNDVNKPTGKIFTIVGNRCPLTRITSEIVSPKETTISPVITSDLKVYSRRPKASRSVESTSKSKIVKSKTSNTKEPNQSQGSTISNTSSSLIIRKLNDHIAKIMGYGDYQMGNVTISRVYYVEGESWDPIDIRVDIIHLEPVAAVAFPAAAVEELTAMRFRVDIAEAENPSLCAKIKTTEAIEKITRNRERHVRIKMEQ